MELGCWLLELSFLLRSINDLANGGFYFVACALFVLAGDGGDEVLGLMVGDEVNGGATESAAGKACPNAAGMRPGKFNQEVEFGRAVFEQSAGAFMPLEHVLAELPVVFLAQSAFASDDAGDFGDDMTGTFVFARGQFRFVGLDPTWFDRTKVPGAEFVRGRVTDLAQLVVFAADEGMFDTRMANNDGFTDERLLFDCEETKVDTHGMPGFAEEGGNLVEQTGLDADKLVLGGLAEFGEEHFLGRRQRRQFIFGISPRRKGGARFAEAERIETTND